MTRYYIIAVDECEACGGKGRVSIPGENGSYPCPRDGNCNGKIERRENANRWLADMLFDLMVPGGLNMVESIEELLQNVMNLLNREQA